MKAFGIIGVVFGLGFIFGLFLGGFLKSNFGIEYVGYVVVVFFVINLLMAYFLLLESLEEFKFEMGLLFENLLFDFCYGLKKLVVNELLIINFIFIIVFLFMIVLVILLWEEYYGLNEE